MAADVDAWLYGAAGEEASKSPETEAQPSATENGRPSTPTLDDMETETSNLGAPLQTPTNKIVSTAPDLQPKATTPTEDVQGVDEGEGEGEEEEEEEDSDSDDDDVQITIGEIQTATPGFVHVPYPRMPLTPGAGGGVLTGKKVDMGAVPRIQGQSIFELSLDAAADKPWRMPGADITDFFNYGFTEETWKLYSEKQRRTRSEVLQLNKIAVHNTRGITIPTGSSTQAIPALGAPPAFPPTGIFPPVSMVTTPTSTFAGAIVHTAVGDTGGKTPERKASEQGGDGASDGRATPGVDTTEINFDTVTSMSKTGLLPPPPASLPPPPLPFPPPPIPGVSSQDNIAAAMAAAAMLGGIRPPDHHLAGLPPPPLGLPPGLPPPFHPHLPGPHDGVLPPPFPGMPPPFHLPGGEHGLPLDERGLPIPPELMGGPGGGGFPWDPSLGPPHPEMFDGFPYRRSRSRSRSSSLSRSRSRSSSEGRDRKLRRRERDRRHRRHSRSRSRSRDRERERSDRAERHRTSRHRRDHHRDRHDRERDRDRDRDRDKDRERERDRDRDREREKGRDKDKERSSRRRDKEERSRHERSHRHRSSSRDRKDEERSSRKEKREHREPREAKEQPAEVRESRSKSRTPT